MSVYLPERFRFFEDTHDIGDLLEQLIEATGKSTGRINPQLVRRAALLIAHTGLAPEQGAFIEDLASRLEHGESGERMWEDIAFAIRTLAEVEYRMKSYTAAGEEAQPTEGAKKRFDELLTALNLDERPEERLTKSLRYKAILSVLKRRPGLYVTELYRELTRQKKVAVTYGTVWDDIHQMESAKQLVTVGGPQGSRRYCFVHPSSIPNRQAYYGNYFGVEGIIEESLTKRFSVSKTWVDLFRVNSHVRPLIIVTEFGVVKEGMVGKTTIKTFGKLQRFSYLHRSVGLEPRQRVSKMDVLRSLSLSAVTGDEEDVLWYDRSALGGSLYPSGTSVGM